MNASLELMREAERQALERDIRHSQMGGGLLRREPSMMEKIGGAVADYAVPDRYSEAFNPSLILDRVQLNPNATMQDIPDMSPMLMDMMPQAGLAGITAYHGSPHLFKKFDMSKIGTGEGVQTYGHGLYFAENPTVANSYLKPNSYGGQLSPEFMSGLPKEAREDAITAVSLRKAFSPQLIKETLADLKNKVTPEQYRHIENASDNPGNLYKVDIPDEHIDKMLDWDKPLSEQPQALKEMFSHELTKIHNATKQYLDSLSLKGRKTAGEMLSDDPANLVNGTHDKSWSSLAKTDPNIDHNLIHDINLMKDNLPSGSSLYERLTSMEAVPPFDNSKRFSSGAKPASEYLLSKGIKGIKYLDQGSRGAGKGTSNFVLFDDQIPQILEINDKPVRGF